MTEALTKLFEDISDHWGAYLAALVALSGLTMSLIQIAKDVLGLRMRFHRAKVLQWLDEPTSLAGTPPPLERQLLRLASGSNERALYDAELADVCIQLSAAIQLLVDYPGQAPDLLKTVARGAHRNDLDLLVRVDGAQPADPDQRQQVFDARNRVRALAHRSVEILKLQTATGWRRRMQASSFVVSVSIALVALMMSGGLKDRPGAVLWTALLAGFLAPVARDLLAAVEQLRR